MPIDMINDKPGPELDVKLAEKLFNLRVDERKAGYLAVWNKEGQWEWLQPYSTTWNGLQLVVEEMDKRGWDFELSYCNGIATAQFGSAPHSQRDSAPFATALAALKALEDSQS